MLVTTGNGGFRPEVWGIRVAVRGKGEGHVVTSDAGIT